MKKILLFLFLISATVFSQSTKIKNFDRFSDYAHFPTSTYDTRFIQDAATSTVYYWNAPTSSYIRLSPTAGGGTLSGGGTLGKWAIWTDTNALGDASYVPEDVANKSTSTTLGGLITSDTKYPSQKAVKTYVDTYFIPDTSIANLSGTTNRLSVTGGTGAVLSAVTLDVNTSLLPSPLLADTGKALIASGANTAAWTTITTTPSGSSGYIQFNTSSAFDSDSNFVWNKTTHRLGIGVASPSYSIDTANDINIATGKHYKINGTNLAATDIGAEPTLTKGNLTEATSSVLTITGGTSSVIGSGTTIQVKKATASVDGYLGATDFSNFDKGKRITATGKTTNFCLVASSLAPIPAKNGIKTIVVKNYSNAFTFNVGTSIGLSDVVTNASIDDGSSTATFNTITVFKMFSDSATQDLCFRMTGGAPYSVDITINYEQFVD